MTPLIVLIAAFLVFRALGFLWPYFADWHLALRAALGVMFLLTASAHWGKRRPDLIRMVPDGVGDPATWVTLTGIAEVAIAITLQIPRLAPFAASAAIVMLCCIFPANIKAARENLTILNQPVPPIVPRLLIQLIFIGALLATFEPR
jgi:uncharacterized membrane protein